MANLDPDNLDQEKPPRPRKELRQGFSTGTAAAAAAQGALYELLGLPCPERVEVPLPGGGSLTIPLHYHRRRDNRGEAAVIKDAGDDPDVTNGAEIGVRVWRLDGSGAVEAVEFHGGGGVGRVTKPGLALAVGEPAINPVPRRMIRRSLSLVWERVFPGQPMRLGVEVFVPLGEELARHTLNPRLGIIGGISILGTTGLVKPFSHAAYRATIVAGLKVARAAGLKRIVFSTGGKSESHLQALLPELPPEAFVQMGDYVRFALKTAGNLKFAAITVGAFFGKSVKIAQGKGHTHASRGLADLKKLGRLVLETTGEAKLAQAVSRANTGRQALEILLTAQALPAVNEVGKQMLAALRAFTGPGPELTGVILDFAGKPLWRGEDLTQRRKQNNI
ncbi:MAG: cobalt-precorrin-5B (C(1))-methyltransferase [Deltaproteobacteria bacterium]|nr:cobalt-precorrin-5B (C(1))-methyltransferase [Deltaproteobacteria bacterium]